MRCGEQREPVLIRTMYFRHKEGTTDKKENQSVFLQRGDQFEVVSTRAFQCIVNCDGYYQDVEERLYSGEFRTCTSI